MKRFLWLAIVLLALGATASAQVTGPARKLRWGATDPATCSPNGDVFINTTTHVQKICSSTNTWTAVGGAGGGDAFVASPLSQFAPTTSAQLAGVLSDETGSGGGFVRATSPTISAPTITGHPVIEGVTSTGATGSGKFVFGTSPDFTTGITIGGVAVPTISNTATLTGKTYDTAGSGNVFKINGSQFTSIGSGLNLAAGVLTATGGGGGSPGGSSGNVQVNSSGSFAGLSGSSFSGSDLSLGGRLNVGGSFDGVFVAPTFRSATNALFFIGSEDGIHFAQLNKYDEPCYTPTSPQILRDPSMMIRGGKNWIVHTTAFAVMKNFALISSPHLCSDWTHIQDVDTSGDAFVQRTYAPEWFVDPRDDSVHVYFAGGNTDATEFRLFEIHPTTSDLSSTWSSPVQITGTSLPSMIDPFVVPDGASGVKIFFSVQPGDGYVGYLTCTTLTSGCTVTHGGTDWAGWGSAMEGANLVQMDTNRWRVYLDHYPSLGIYYSESTDGFATWSTKVGVQVYGEVVHPTIIRTRDVGIATEMAAMGLAQKNTFPGNVNVAGGFTASNGPIISGGHLNSGANIYLPGWEEFVSSTAPAGASGVSRLYAKGAGTASSLYFKKGDGTEIDLAALPGSVSSVGQSFTGGLISVAGSPITTSGTLALTVAGTSGGVPYFSSSSAWASSAALTANMPMIGGGAGAAPSVGTVQGNTTKFVSYAGSAPATDDCAKFDANGNITTNGSACGGGGGGSGTVNSGSQYQAAYYATAGTAVSGASSLVTDSNNNWSVVNRLGVGVAPSTNRAMTVMDVSNGATYFQFKQAGAAETTIGVETGSKQFLIFKESGGSYLWYTDPSGNTVQLGSLSTVDSTSGQGPAWKLGAKKTATVSLDTTGYIEVNIGGTTYKLGLVN